VSESGDRLEGLVIPFYGGSDRRMFAIERRAMDRDGHVVDFLDGALPGGLMLDVGAGDGYAAELLTRGGRTVVAMEPDGGMVDRSRSLVWARGVAQQIPFHDDVFSGAYSTWAFFLTGTSDEDVATGLRELERVVSPGGPLVIVDNAGDDEFTALSDRPIADDGSRWTRLGFERHVIDTSFRFDTLAEARELIGFYFGVEKASGLDALEIGFRVAAYVGRSGRLGTEG
jgi:SAM-dependent methyltransferase